MRTVFISKHTHTHADSVSLFCWSSTDGEGFVLLSISWKQKLIWQTLSIINSQACLDGCVFLDTSFLLSGFGCVFLSGWYGCIVLLWFPSEGSSCTLVVRTHPKTASASHTNTLRLFSLLPRGVCTASRRSELWSWAGARLHGKTTADIPLTGYSCTWKAGSERGSWEMWFEGLSS